jgi:hypothetical protein
MFRPNNRRDRRGGRLLALSLVLLAACSGGSNEAAARPPKPPRSTPASSSIVPASNVLASIPQCGQPVDSASVPASFPPIALPSGLVIAPVATSAKSHLRVDMIVPDPVKKTYRFFLDSLAGHNQVILMRDYEGFEAEVYFAPKRGAVTSLSTVSIVIFCDNQSLVSIEVPKEGEG